MRIAFCTSSLEPGKDGVGDYARALAAECIARGHHCVMLALNDRHVHGSTNAMQLERGTRLEVLRLPASLPWRHRSAAAQEWLDRHASQWVSLQFVPYGHHPRGLVGALGRRLSSVIGTRRVHLMFHELWIGMQRQGAPWRYQLVGRLQRRAILSLVRSLGPAVIHTSNQTYANCLGQFGVRAAVLPLFGNVPVLDGADPQWLAKEMVRLGVPADRALSRDTWRFGIFGAIHPSWSPEPLFSYLASAARGRKMIVASIGRLGPGEVRWRAIHARYGEPFSFVRLGERPVEELSTFLQNVDFGIATTPWQLIGKSGSAAAMLDHGLPVIVARDDQDFGFSSANSSADPLLYRMDSELPRWLASVRRQAAHARLPEIASQLLHDLDRQ